MFTRKLIPALSCLLLLCVSAVAQSVHTPQPGSQERRAIMDALRAPAKADFGLEVIFKVNRLRVAGKWAFALVTPIHPDGSAINFKKTKYREQVEQGDFDPMAQALLRREGGEWTVREWSFGATDVEFQIWPERYNFPASLIQ